MGACPMTPTPPPGFTLDEPQQGGGAPPPPPPGFTLDQPISQDDYWGDVKKSAMEGIQQFPSILKKNAQQAGTVARGIAGGFGEAGTEMAQGTPFKQTHVGQALDAGTDIAKGVWGGFKQGVKDTGSLAMAPFEGKPMAQTDIAQKFRERPFSVPLGVASTVLPIFKGARMATGEARSVFAGAEPNFLERAGARGVNDSLGIRGGTVEDMSRGKANPGEVGVGLGMKLADEGLAGKGPTEGFTQAQKMHDQYGKQVGSALDAIRKTNKGLGEYPELADPLKVDATPVIKPLLDKANELRDSGYPNDRFESRFHRAAYNSLAKEAEANNGFISIDNVTGEMRKMGKMLKTASDDHTKIIKGIYGKLADIRDGMVEDIASSVNQPELANNLRSANAGFSRYARVLPDIKKAASKESVQPTSIFQHPIDAAGKVLGPRVAQMALGAGKMLRGGSKMADTATAMPGQVASGLLNKGKQIAGDQRGSIFPESALPPGMRANEMFTPSEQKYKVNELNEQQYLDNNDFPNALKAKWGMANNAGGSMTPGDVAVPEKTLTESKAREFLKKAKGDKDLARKLAASDGWSF